MLPLVTQTFDGFGACAQALAAKPDSAEIPLPVRNASARKQIRTHCPRLPGVYGMIDPEGELVYVGKSKSLRDRLVQYFYPKSADRKAKRIVSHARRLTWETAPHEFAALLRELELIRRWTPRFNVQGQPGRIRRGYIVLTRAPAPSFRLTAAPAIRGLPSFGPVIRSRAIRTAVDRMNQLFRLRDCPQRTKMVFSDQLELFSDDRRPQCLRYEIGTCLGPCAAKCSAADYQRDVDRAVAFLSGADLSPLAEIETKMREAAQRKRFERAASLRDDWQALGELQEQLRRVHDAEQRYSMIYPLPGYTRRECWHLIHQGRHRGVINGPLNRRSAPKRLRLLEQTYSSAAQLTQPERDDFETMMLIGRWFRKYPDELKRTLTPDEALRQCRQVVGLKPR